MEQFWAGLASNLLIAIPVAMAIIREHRKLVNETIPETLDALRVEMKSLRLEVRRLARKARHD